MIGFAMNHGDFTSFTRSIGLVLCSVWWSLAWLRTHSVESKLSYWSTYWEVWLEWPHSSPMISTLCSLPLLGPWLASLSSLKVFFQDKFYTLWEDKFDILFLRNNSGGLGHGVCGSPRPPFHQFRSEYLILACWWNFAVVCVVATRLESTRYDYILPIVPCSRGSISFCSGIRSLVGVKRQIARSGHNSTKDRQVQWSRAFKWSPRKGQFHTSWWSCSWSHIDSSRVQISPIPDQSCRCQSNMDAVEYKLHRRKYCKIGELSLWMTNLDLYLVSLTLVRCKCFIKSISHAQH